MDGRIKGWTICVAAIALAALAVTATAEAQSSSGRRPVSTTMGTTSRKDRSTSRDMTGFVLGAHTIAATGLTVSGEDLDGSVRTGFGPGAGVMVGYGFTRIWSGYASLDVAKVGASGSDFEGNWGLSHFEAGVRANLPYGGPTNLPYVSASIGRRALSARVTYADEGEEFDMTLTGAMFGVGGGIQRVISPALTLDGGVELGFGRFGHYDADGESGSLAVNGTTSVRLRFGVMWRPSGRLKT
jgi:hypothetical protein